MKIARSLLAGSIATFLLGAAVNAARADSLHEIYQLAKERDPTLRAAAAARDAAIEAGPQARSGILPTIGFGGDVSRNRYDERKPTPGIANPTYSTNQIYSLNLTQPVFRWDRWVALDQADYRVAQAQAEYGAAEQELMVRVSDRYFAVLAAQDAVRLAGKQKESFGRQLEQAQQRFEVGLSAITDVQEAQAGYDLALATEIRAQNQLDSAREQLREIIGEPRENLDPVQDTGFAAVAPEPQNQQNWVDSALQQNPGLAAARAASEAAREQIGIARAGHYPTLDAVASYSYNDRNFGVGGFRLERNDGAVGLQLAVPLYQGGVVNSRTREARALFDQAREQLDVTQRNIERQTRDAFRGVVSGISQIKAAEQARTSSATALEAAQTGFEVGTRTIVDVLNARRILTEAELNLFQARYDYLLNSLRLKQAAGTLAPTDLQAMGKWFQASASAPTKP